MVYGHLEILDVMFIWIYSDPMHLKDGLTKKDGSTKQDGSTIESLCDFGKSWEFQKLSRKLVNGRQEQ